MTFRLHPWLRKKWSTTQSVDGHCLVGKPIIIGWVFLLQCHARMIQTWFGSIYYQEDMLRICTALPH